MPIELQNYQWELDGVVFGLDCEVAHEADSEPASYSWRTQDQPVPSGDGMIPGRDLIDPGSWNFKLWTDCEDEGSALTALESLATAWRGDSIRTTSGKVLPLRYRLNDRTRRVYGRPRRFAAPLGPEFHSGRIMITSDFQTVSELFFDDDEQSKDIGIVASVGGGFYAPFYAPITTDPVTQTDPNTIIVGGKLPTPIIAEFHGPLEDGYLEVDGQRWIQLTGSVAYDTPVIVDSRPWKMSVYRPDGSGAGGMLSRRTKLPGLLLSPGEHHIVLGGRDTTGTAFVRVKWRGAHPTV